ncbi:hypothetical protein C8J56DRAFT_917505 [Mycena floridula]|nr:hypothetical protein C8J56DRAFT_917505 [Mycena floridula]
MSLLVLIAMMFILDNVSFALTVYAFFYQTREILLNGTLQGENLTRIQNSMATVDAVNQALFLLILIPGDCIVIWRAYVVWTRTKSVIAIPVLFSFGWIVNFPFFVACNIRHKDQLSHVGGTLGPAPCLVTSAFAWILSFCANVSATLMILCTAWSYYIFQRNLLDSDEAPRRSSRVARVLLLLVESGLAYFLLMIMSITVSLWPVSGYGPSLVITAVLADILSPHCIAMVPTLTILLVSLYGSFDEQSIISISQPIHFATLRVAELSDESVISPPMGPEADIAAPDFHNSGPKGSKLSAK